MLGIQLSYIICEMREVTGQIASGFCDVFHTLFLRFLEFDRARPAELQPRCLQVSAAAAEARFRKWKRAVAHSLDLDQLAD